MDHNLKRVRKRGGVGFMDGGSSDEEENTATKRVNLDQRETPDVVATASKGSDTKLRDHPDASASAKADPPRKQVSLQ